MRVAAVWGDTVLSVRHLRSGESYVLDGPAGQTEVRPEGSRAPQVIIAAVGARWEIDCQGASGGLMISEGKQQDPAKLAHLGHRVPVASGDYGLLRYGDFAVFFQLVNPAPPLRRRPPVDWALGAALVFAGVTASAFLVLLYWVTSPPPLDKPVELMSPAELAARPELRVVGQVSSPSSAEPWASALRGFSPDLRTPGVDEHSEMGGVEPPPSDAEQTGPVRAVTVDKNSAWSPGDILRHVAPRAGALQACYERAVLRNPGVSPTVSLRGQVSPSGSLTATLQRSVLVQRGLERCFALVLQQVHFPPTERPSGFVLSLVFEVP